MGSRIEITQKTVLKQCSMERKGRNGGELKSFEPGQSGNPNGRPKGVPNAATRMRRFLELEMQSKNPITKEDESFTVAELMDLQIIAKAIRGDITAWEKINDRLEGKASQKSEVAATVNVTGPIKFDSLSVDERRTFLEILEKMQSSGDKS